MDRNAVLLNLAGVAVLHTTVALASLMHVALQQLLLCLVRLPLSLCIIILLRRDGHRHSRHGGHRKEGHERDKEDAAQLAAQSCRAHHRMRSSSTQRPAQQRDRGLFIASVGGGHSERGGEGRQCRRSRF
jgi:hypothetical protein